MFRRQAPLNLNFEIADGAGNVTYSSHHVLKIQLMLLTREGLNKSEVRRGMKKGSVCVLIPSVGNANELKVVLEGLKNRTTREQLRWW